MINFVEKKGGDTKWERKRGKEKEGDKRVLIRAGFSENIANANLYNFEQNFSEFPDALR